jgi:hypothetical protein
VSNHSPSNAGNSNAGNVPSSEVIDGRPFPGQQMGEAESPEQELENVIEPAKVMRIGSMVKQLLEEVRGTPLDERSRERLAEIYERSIVEISSALSPDLAQELHELALPQLVGWLEGLFHGIQATLFAQQFAARQQLEQMRQIPQNMSGPDQVPGTYI